MKSSVHECGHLQELILLDFVFFLLICLLDKHLETV